MTAIAVLVLFMAVMGIFSIVYSGRLIFENTARRMKIALLFGYVSGILLLALIAASIIWGLVEQLGLYTFE